MVLSCCEHYGNVLYRYNNSELKAVRLTATQRWCSSYHSHFSSHRSLRLRPGKLSFWGLIWSVSTKRWGLDTLCNQPTLPIPIHISKSTCSIPTLSNLHFRVPFSNVPFPQIQIHGPVCLSENVDCIVVNDRHSFDPAMKELLEQFVDRNKCNLIWMEPIGRIDYPSFTHAPTHLPSLAPPHPPIFAPPIPPPGTCTSWLNRMCQALSTTHDTSKSV